MLLASLRIWIKNKKMRIDFVGSHFIFDLNIGQLLNSRFKNCSIVSKNLIQKAAFCHK